MRKSVALLMLLCSLCMLSVYVERVKEQAVVMMGTEPERPVVVIDAGHGGKDPGKVGVGEVLEKDINLAIAKKLEALLWQNDVAAMMLRTEDKDLASENATNRKNEDFRERARLIREAEPVLTVSIHQNSYPEGDVDGAQVFYLTGSEEGRVLATMLQESLRRELADGNHRVAKANRDYYLLKQSTEEAPVVIVECGFLSNAREAELLSSEEYQEKIAFSLLLGILEYINTGKDKINQQ
ncbi:MAG: N-acetylmuramoyl-L-alanine amidase [Lachnospiraceae bacterium]|nr:N-acetylmuramoyl-L-alanine amidase [Lachnospiraceae bacterium]